MSVGTWVVRNHAEHHTNEMEATHIHSKAPRFQIQM
jgi:hypothetical protein